MIVPIIRVWDIWGIPTAFVQFSTHASSLASFEHRHASRIRQQDEPHLKYHQRESEDACPDTHPGYGLAHNGVFAWLFRVDNPFWGREGV
jgi:hypothetical protein